MVVILIERFPVLSCCSGPACLPQTYYALDGWFLASYSSLAYPQEDLKISWKSYSNSSDSGALDSIRIHFDLPLLSLDSIKDSFFF